LIGRLLGGLGRRSLHAGFRVIGVVFGVFEFEQCFIGGKVQKPPSGLILSAFLGLHEEETDVGKAGGAAGRDAVGGEGGEEIAEDVVDVDLGDEIAGGAGELGGEIVLALLDAGAAGVGEAEAVVLGVGGEAAHASIGEFELAKVEDIGWSCVRHGEIIAQYIPQCQYTKAYRYEDSFGFRMAVEKSGEVSSRESVVGSTNRESGKVSESVKRQQEKSKPPTCKVGT
jgi:hypothetical protein